MNEFEIDDSRALNVRDEIERVTGRSLSIDYDAKVRRWVVEDTERVLGEFEWVDDAIGFAYSLSGLLS